MADRISEQTILEKAYNPDTKTLAVESYGYDGVQAQRGAAPYMATKITKVGDVSYIGIAAPGTAQATAKWQCKKIDSSVAGTTVITWAGGTPNFIWAATDLTSLEYS
jgi:hypothetical protein